MLLEGKNNNLTTKNGVPYRIIAMPSNKVSLKCPYAMTPTSITVHNTDNEMPAINEINYMHDNWNETSYQVAIDEKEAIQGSSFYRNAWHSGDGFNGTGNRTSIGVEICRNYDRTRRTTNLNQPLLGQYRKAEDNAVKVIAQICVDVGIVANVNTIRSHKERSGKNCPSKMYNDGTWESYRQRIINEYNRLMGIKVAGTSTVAKTHVVKAGDTLWKISQTYNCSVSQLQSWNGIKGGLINIGQVIKVVAPTIAKPAPAPKPKPTPSKPTLKTFKEKGSFLPNDTIKIRNKPSTSGKHVGSYKVGEVLDNYHTVHHGNGYIWLQYTSFSKEERYLPIAEYNGTKRSSAWWGRLGEVGEFNKPQPKPKKEYVILSAKEPTWSIYRLGAVPVIKNRIDVIRPANFGGLEYQVLGRENNGDCVIIQTQDYGKVKIYVKGESGATFKWK